MDIGSLHAAVSRAGAIGTALNLKQGPRAVATFAAAKMNLITPDRCAGRAVPAADERRVFVLCHDGRDVEQAQAFDRAGTAIHAVGIGYRSAEHLIAAA